MESIVILGAGFAGIRTALDLEKKLSGRVRIILIDRNSYHLFTPALYEVASAYGVKRDQFSVRLKETITIPVLTIIEGRAIDFIQTEIDSLNVPNSLIKTQGGEEIKYAYLVIALGSQSFDYNVRGVGDCAYQFKSLEDGLMIHDKIESFFDDILASRRQLPLKIIVCGGGFTGVEFSAELALFMSKMSRNLNLNRKSYQIMLCEAGPKILPFLDDMARRAITERLTKLGVIVTTGAPIEEVSEGGVKLSDGRRQSGDMVVWTAGVCSNRFLESVKSVYLTPAMKVAVDDYLRVKERSNIFAAGDCIEFINPKTKKPVPMSAYAAIEQGRVVAGNIIRSIEEQPLQPYRPPEFQQWVVPTGGKYAVAVLSKNKILKGIGAWALRELINLRYLISILPVSKALSLFKTDLTVFTKND